MRSGFPSKHVCLWGFCDVVCCSICLSVSIGGSLEVRVFVGFPCRLIVSRGVCYGWRDFCGAVIWSVV